MLRTLRKKKEENVKIFSFHYYYTKENMLLQKEQQFAFMLRYCANLI